MSEIVLSYFVPARGDSEPFRGHIYRDDTGRRLDFATGKWVDGVPEPIVLRRVKAIAGLHRAVVVPVESEWKQGLRCDLEYYREGSVPGVDPPASVVPYTHGQWQPPDPPGWAFLFPVVPCWPGPLNPRA